MALTIEQYREWKQHRGTQELMSSLRESLEMYVAKMLTRDRPDPDNDQWIRAYAKITDEILSWQPEIISDSEMREVEDVEH